MVRRHLAAAFAAALFVLASSARAAEPPHYTFSPRPPGEIVQSLLFYPAGEGMESQWRAVVSRVHMGGAAYQWYLSIYAIDYDTATYRLRYRSPGSGPPLSRVTRANGSNLWFPLQTMHIVGAAELEPAGVADLVVQSHETGADCGSAEVSIFNYDWAQQRVRRIAHVTNGCALAAYIVRVTARDSVRLVGPYYGPNAALCCPTKVSAVAYLRYRRGRWIETPSYFPIRT